LDYTDNLAITEVSVLISLVNGAFKFRRKYFGLAEVSALTPRIAGRFSVNGRGFENGVTKRIER
jgi:hypothetical protein